MSDDQKEVLNGSQWPIKATSIAQKYLIPSDQSDNLQKAVLKTILGTITPKDLQAGFTTTLGLSPAAADKMYGELRDQIFTPLQEFTREQIAEYAYEDFDPDAPQEPEVVVPTKEVRSIEPVSQTPTPASSNAKVAADFLSKIVGTS